MQNAAIFPLFYLPPVDYVARMVSCKLPVLLDASEHFPKQTYRNRASIATHNGRLDLVVPVIKGAKVHTRVKDVRISNDFRWQRQHWMSLQTAYRSSAWFEFYEDKLQPFYHKPYHFLFEFNEELLHTLFALLKVNPAYRYTSEYILPGEVTDDYRESIHPKKSLSGEVRPYYQLFQENNGFIPNLSIIDLLFSQGPGSAGFLTNG